MSGFRSGFAVFASILGLTETALADRSTIKSEYDHPSYVFEAEPHVVLAPFHKGGVGAGFAGTFDVADRGFINRLNDSVGAGFGVNWATNEKFILSGHMQWNFWLSERWSVFGEPGVAVATDKKPKFWPHLGAGGRFAFTENVMLTMRVGFPVWSVGVSFFL